MKLFLLSFVLILSPIAYAQTIPQQLDNMGFCKETLLSYNKIGDKEYFTFSDWTTQMRGDGITFVVQDGKIIDVFKGVSEKGREI